MTAEVEPYVCDEAEARELTDAIKSRAEQTWSLIEQAWTHQAWAALGYVKWDDYCTTEFGTTLRIRREDRLPAVTSMRELGMSTRAIGSALGVSDGTVRTDLAAGAQNYAPAADPLAAKIAAELAASDHDYAVRAAASVEDIADAEIIDEPQPAPTVTGLDGRTYQPTGRKNRKPITETAKTRGFALRKSVDSLTSVFTDDRYAANEKQVADLVRGHLLYVAETVAAVLDQLPTN